MLISTKKQNGILDKKDLSNMTTKEDLLHLIRQEKVILWVGAGFSKYAGYPLGYELATKIKKTLPAEKRKLLKSELSSLTEDFVNIHGGDKSQLYSLLKKIFTKKPSSTKFHDYLSKIPHIKTIITTNYDSLIENSYKENCCVVWKEKDISNIKDNKTLILKLHGDISDIDSIIITDSEYRQFIAKDYNTPLWATLMSKIASKNVLFLGYKHNDQHILALFDKISSLTPEVNNHFIIATGLKEHEKEALQRKRIHVIDEDAESFISTLYNSIKDNIIEDALTNNIRLETFNSFLTNHNLSSLTRSTQMGFQLQSIKSLDETVHTKITFNDYKVLDGIMKKGRFEVPSKDINDIDFRIEGIKIPFLSEGGGKLVFKKEPSIMNFDIRFLDIDYDITNLQAEILHLKNKILFKINIENEITLELQTSGKLSKNELKIKVNRNLPKIYKNINSVIRGLKLFYHLLNNEKYKIYLHEIKQSITGNFNLSLNEKDMKDHLNFLQYFEKLRHVEDYFGITFTDIKEEDITFDSNETLNTIILSITGDKRIFKLGSDGIITASIKSYKDTKKMIEKINNEEVNITITYNKPDIVTLHNQELNIGYKQVELVSTKVINVAELIKGSKIAKIVSMNNEAIESYKSKP